MRVYDVLHEDRASGGRWYEMSGSLLNVFEALMSVFEVVESVNLKAVRRGSFVFCYQMCRTKEEFLRG